MRSEVSLGAGEGMWYLLGVEVLLEGAGHVLRQCERVEVLSDSFLNNIFECAHCMATEL